MARQIIPIELPKKDSPKKDSPKVRSVVDNANDLYDEDVYNELLGGGRSSKALVPMDNAKSIISNPGSSVIPKVPKNKDHSDKIRLTNVRLDPSLKRELMFDTYSNETNLKVLLVTLFQEYLNDDALHNRIIYIIKNDDTVHTVSKIEKQTNLNIDPELKLLLKHDVADNETNLKSVAVALSQEYLKDNIFHNKIISIISNRKREKEIK